MREGVNKVALCLFEHNEKAYHAAVRMMDQYGKAAIVHPTGTGKSYIAFKLIEDNPEKVVIWLSPSEYIFKTQLESLKRNDPDFPLANVHFYTYAKLMCCTQAQLDEIAAQKPAYIILDEFHRAGAECWGESTMALLKLCPDAKLLGLTATNIRYLDNNRDMAEELFDSRVASNMTLGEAVVRGILPAPKYVTTVYQYQKALAKYQARVDNLRAPGIQDVNQKYLDALRRALEQADGLDKVFAHHITNKSGKYIVFCANKEHMDEMVSHVPEWFAGVNPDVVVYEAYSDDPNTDKAFADFKTDTSNRLKLLFCIDMLNEGVHVEGISGVILFRPTISPIIYKQQIGRALTAGDTAAPLILDVVNNFEGLTSISGLQSEMQEAVHRLYANGEGDKIVTERFEVIEQVHDCRVHIVNYAKTRPVYDAYRKSGYSSKFLEAHREEVTLHKTAKAAFNESGLKKLPKVKDLNAEYSALLTKKKALYPEYRKTRDEMQEIVKAQKNVELFFAEEKDSKQVEQIR